MKLLAKVDFSFAKLAEALPNIISNIVTKSIKTSVEASREAIKKGLSPELYDSTMAVRKLRGIAGSTPLFATGALYNSIRGNDKGLEFKKYGQYHREGFTPKYIPAINRNTGKPYISPKTDDVAMTLNKTGIEVEPRNFARIGKLQTKDFQNKIMKALRK